MPTLTICDGPGCLKRSTRATDIWGTTVEPGLFTQDGWLVLYRQVAPPLTFHEYACLAAWIESQRVTAGAGCSHDWHRRPSEHRATSSCPRCGAGGGEVATNPEPGGARQ